MRASRDGPASQRGQGDARGWNQRPALWWWRGDGTVTVVFWQVRRAKRQRAMAYNVRRKAYARRRAREEGHGSTAEEGRRPWRGRTRGRWPSSTWDPGAWCQDVSAATGMATTAPRSRWHVTSHRPWRQTQSELQRELRRDALLTQYTRRWHARFAVKAASAGRIVRLLFKPTGLCELVASYRSAMGTPAPVDWQVAVGFNPPR